MLWHIDLKFFIWLCLMYYISNSSVTTLCPPGCLSVHPFSARSSCIDKFSWNLKFDVGFLNAFLLEKYYNIKITFKNVPDGRIMHRLRCSGIFISLWKNARQKIWFICSFISHVYHNIRLLEISPSHFGHLASFIGLNNEMYCDVLLDRTILYQKIR